jgi:hypothetical protein
MQVAILAKRGILLALAFVLVVPGIARAQQIEINPYAGGFFPGTWAETAKFNKEGLYGAKGGVFLTRNAEVEGNFGYIHHFRFRETPDPGSRAILWDVNGSYNFVSPSLRRAEPFVTFGIGGLTTDIRGGENQTAALLDPASINPNTTLAPVTLGDGDTFFTMNYGGGVKGLRLWGPVGLRADLRGRTLPNFRDGHALSWLEATGGVTFSWGERR